jgi:hypothetical protein
VGQYWVCQNCKSLNRAGAARCYSCKQNYGSKPVVAGSSAPEPPRPVAPTARQDLSLGQVPPAYISRPLAPAPGPSSYSMAAAIAAAEARRGPAGPITVIKRRVARSLAAHPIVGVRNIGYLAALLIVAALAAAIALVVLALPVALDLLRNADAPHAWGRLPADRQSLLIALSAATVIVGLFALLFFSLFMGLSTHNAPALGADMALLTPYAAGVSWLRAIWRHLQIAFCATVPTVIVWIGYTIPGLIVAIVFVELTLRRLEDPWGWFRGPNRHLPDLYAKLGTEGSMESLTASIWAVCFRVANSLAVLLWLLPPLALVANVVAKAAGHASIPGWQAGGIGPLQGAVAAVAAATLLTGAISMLLLVPLILGFVRRQKARRELVRLGRARSWVGGKPAAVDYVSVTPGRPRPIGWDEDDRIVERLPRDIPEDDGGAALLAGLGSRGAGPAGPGFGSGPPPDAPDATPPTAAGFVANESPGQLPGRGFGSTNDQASLNSPSTTSSFPWSGPPPPSE